MFNATGLTGIVRGGYHSKKVPSSWDSPRCLWEQTDSKRVNYIRKNRIFGSVDNRNGICSQLQVFF